MLVPLYGTPLRREDIPVSATTTIQNEASRPVCISCGLQVPTKSLDFQQNVGMVVTRRTTTMAGPMCRRCARAYFKSYTLTTFFLGWWGTISLVMTPIFIISNFIQFFKSLSLPEPAPAAANVPYDFSGVKIRVGTPSLKFKLIYGAIVWTIILGIIADQSVDFVEKYAPSLNARLHRGGITDDADAQYAGTKIGEDITALEADTKSKEWPALRAEFLAREPFLNDLKAQYNKLQDALATERSNGVMANDPCEQLTETEFAPALNDYANLQSQFLSLLKSTATPDENAAASIDAMEKQDKAVLTRLSKYFSETDAKGCSK